MKYLVTRAIVLSRTNYGEADRILTVLTRDFGKLSLIAKGSRRPKSKLAGGIELFGVSQITFAKSRGEVHTLISSRLEAHWDKIIGDLPRMMFGYEIMKTIDRVAPDSEGQEFYKLLKGGLTYLNQPSLGLAAVQVWFWLNVLSLTGHQPDLRRDADKNPLVSGSLYEFSVPDMMFAAAESGKYRGEHIKLLRLALERTPIVLAHVKQFDDFSEDLAQLSEQMAKYHLHLK